MRVTDPHFRLRRVGGLFGFSRQAFYQHKSRQMTGEERDEQVLSLVEQFRRDHPRIGGKKLYELMKEELVEREIKMGRVMAIFVQ